MGAGRVIGLRGVDLSTCGCFADALCVYLGRTYLLGDADVHDHVEFCCGLYGYWDNYFSRDAYTQWSWALLVVDPQGILVLDLRS